MSTITNSVTSSLNQLQLSNLPQLKLSNTHKTTILSHQIIDMNPWVMISHTANVIENLEWYDLNPKLDLKKQ